MSTDAHEVDALLAGWEDVWLASLRRQVLALHHRRQLHGEFTELLDGQDHPDMDVFKDAFHRMYVESQVMAVRRQAALRPGLLRSGAGFDTLSSLRGGTGRDGPVCDVTRRDVVP